MSKKSNLVQPSETEVMSIFHELLPRSVIKELLKQVKGRFYWRLFTPLITLWGLIFQRISIDKSCDGLLSHLETGAADNLDREDKHQEPLSKRLGSQNTSAYAQARKRLPLELLVGALRHIQQVISGWLHKEQQNWKGHAVRWFDGTTVRTRPPAT